MLTPGSLAIIGASFRPGDRSKAVGAWSGLSGVATAIGPFLGGWLVQAVSWRLIFAIRVDAAGGILVTLGLIGVTYGLIDGPVGGWIRPAPLASEVVGALLLIAFVARGRRARMPMLPLSLFTSHRR